MLEDGQGTKQVKTYLVLTVGYSGDITSIVNGMDVDVEDHRSKGRRKENKSSRRDEILKTKARLERKGKIVKNTSKYTGRKRRIQF